MQNVDVDMGSKCSLKQCLDSGNVFAFGFYIYIYIHSFLAGDSVVVFSVSPSVSTRNFSAQLLCPLLTVVGATLVVK